MLKSHKSWPCFVLASTMLSGICNAEDVVFFPKDATLEEGVNLEYQKVLNWRKVSAEATWDFQLKEKGAYNLFLELSAVGWADGSQVEILIDGKKVGEFKFPNTHNSIQPLQINSALVPLKPGKHTLTINPIHQRNQWTIGLTRNALLTEQKEITEFVDSSFYEKQDSFAETLKKLRDEQPQLTDPDFLKNVYNKLWADFPHEMCWLTQDIVPLDEQIKNQKVDFIKATTKFFAPKRNNELEIKLLNRVLSELTGKEADQLRAGIKKIENGEVKPNDPRLIAYYNQVCRQRRAQRLSGVRDEMDSIIFAKHQVFGSSSGIYNITETEGLAPGETSGLFKIDLSQENAKKFAPVTEIFDPKGGIVRDPEISYDASKMLFAWRKTAKNIVTTGGPAPDSGNYQIYEMDLATQKTRQLTTDETYGANYDPCYLPNGNILFNSARIVQHITCGWGDHSNLFLMDKDGKYQRQVGFDQVSTEFPTVLNNGQVIYLRRDYNDRGQSAAHAIFVMNTDGTAQTEYYGNQTGTPNSFMHARPIPGSDKVACVLSGYHTRQGGQLAVMNIREGRNHGKGITQVPQGGIPPNKANYDDGYLKDQIQYSDPFPLSETEFIVSRSDIWGLSKTGGGFGEHFGIYYMTSDTRRELLAYDGKTSCLQPFPVMSRKKPAVRPSMADYTKKEGTYYVQDVYLGAAAEGIKPGSVKKMRVIQLLYKADTINSGTAAGPGGSQDTVTPPAHPLAQFDARQILGTATVYEDGSAMFNIPANTPVYFQLLDDKNRCIQTMRSWSTLMPGENFSCVGCHENKSDTPVSAKKTIAMSKGIEQLTPFYGELRGFSFMQDVQPIFDQHCISCHAKGKKAEKLVLTQEPFVTVKHYGRTYPQSYIQLMAARPGPDPSVFRVFNGPESWNRSGPAKADEPNQYVQYWGRLREMPFKPPYFAGAIASGMIKKLEKMPENAELTPEEWDKLPAWEKGHKNIELTPEDWDKLVAWIDLNCQFSSDYIEGNAWGEWGVKRYQNRLKERARNQAINAENVKAYIEAGQP